MEQLLPGLAQLVGQEVSKLEQLELGVRQSPKEQQCEPTFLEERQRVLLAQLRLDWELARLELAPH